MMSRGSSPKALAVLVVLALLAGQARATWSIVVTDTKTGEVAVASATCVNNLDLEKYLPVIRVGLGAGAAQALIDSGATNRQIIWTELGNGTDPAVILSLIQAVDTQFQQRQIGIVDLQARAASFTGSQTSAWAGGLTGTAGTLTYAIQGNILTGAPVVTAARDALLNTNGDLAEKLMAAMLAAQSMGGDGRCSCSPAAPTSCGSPPPGFTKSAHVGFMIIARMGDSDGTCGSAGGCASGSYYLDLNVAGNQTGKPDPVFQLQGLFAAWRAAWSGRPDHVKSQVTLSSSVLDDSGSATADMLIRLIDWQGIPLTQGGATVTVTRASGPGVVVIGQPVDHGNGTYGVHLQGRTKLGRDLLRVVVDDGQGPVTLYPFTSVAVAPSDFLTSSALQLSASLGDDAALALAGGPGLADRQYLVLISISGTTPGFNLGNVYVPLVLDAAVGWSYVLCNSAVLQNTCGLLDQNGAAAAALSFSPGDLAPLAGGTLSLSALTLDPVDCASDAVVVSIVP